MRTLHFGLRVADLEKSLAFYTAVGYHVVGRVPETQLGALTMLQLPGDEFITIELVDDATKGGPVGPGLSHFVIKVESMDTTIAELSARGVDVDAPNPPDASDDFRTAWIVDPDGNPSNWCSGRPVMPTA